MRIKNDKISSPFFSIFYSIFFHDFYSFPTRLFRQAISNIYKLLKPNGTCLLTFLISNPIFDVYLKLSEKEKFSSYMKDVRRFISPYHFEEKPLEAFSEKLYNVNFNIVHMEIRDQIYIYESLEILRCKL